MNDVQLLAVGITFTVVIYASYWLNLKSKLRKLQAQAARKVK